MDKKTRVLFLSTRNSTRSQMAEGFLRALAEDEFEAASAGIDAKDLNLLAVDVMTEIGIDISHQGPKNVSECLKEHFGYVITLCDMAREKAPIFPFTPHLLHWSLEDPVAAIGSEEEKKEVFRRVRDTIHTNVENFLADASEKHAGEPALVSHGAR